MIKLYGTAMSRAGRSLWALEEAAVQYEQVLVAETREPEYLKINPNGHVPTLDDNGTIICESMAINLYVAEKYGKAPLWPSTVEGHGACYQWSLWAMLEVEGPMFDVFKNRILLPADERDEKAAVAGLEKIKAPLKVLDDHLQKSEYLLGKEFTIADLNVASVMILAQVYSTGSVDDSDGAKVDAKMSVASGQPESGDDEIAWRSRFDAE